jgi:DNA-binding CsgD family transcriptional regulator
MVESPSQEADITTYSDIKEVSDADLERLYVEKQLSQSDIAERFNCSRDKVRTQIRVRGILRPKDIRWSRNRIKELYRERGLSQDEVSDILDANPRTVNRHIKHYGLSKTPKEWQRDRYGNSVSFRTTTRGYEVVTIPGGGDYLVHRLVAVAEYGIDAVKENHIHHENGVKWDNRVDNLEPIDPSNHATLHADNTTPLTKRVRNADKSELRTALRDNGYVEAAKQI